MVIKPKKILLSAFRKAKPLWQSAIRRSRSSIYRYIPIASINPYISQSLAFAKKTDARDNEESCPPSDERVDLKCIWGIEFYTPAHTEKLYSSLVKLGWDKPADLGASPRSLIDWISAIREHSLGSGWYHIGYIRPLSFIHPAGMLRHYYKNELPSGVEYAIVQTYNLTSSITCIAVCFALNEKKGAALHEALETPRSTYTKPYMGKGFSIIGPKSQKIDSVQYIRDNNRREIHAWFSSHLPGLFSDANFKTQIPTCEFITVKKTRLLSKEQKSSGFLWCLGLDHWFDAWASKEIPGLRFLWPIDQTRGTYGESHAVLALTENEFTPKDLKKAHFLNSDLEADIRSAYINYFNRTVLGLISHWAIMALLATYERHLSYLRDKLPLEKSARKGLVKVADVLRDIMQKSMNIDAVTRGLKRLTSDGFIKYDFPDFERVEVRSQPYNQTDFAEILKMHIHQRASDVNEADKNLRELLIQYGNIISTRENMVLQKRMKRLSWWMIILAFVTLAAAIVQILVSDNGVKNFKVISHDSKEWLAQKLTSKFKTLIK